MENRRDSELLMPSGFEVESATLHMPVSGGVVAPMEHDHGSMKSRVDELKTRGLDAIESVRRTITTRTDELKSRGSVALSGMRDQLAMRSGAVRQNVAMRGAALKADVHRNPTKWAGIATGAGIGLGLVGRYLRHRAHRQMPHLVIIEAC